MKKISLLLIIVLHSKFVIASPQIYRVCKADGIKIGLYNVGGYAWFKAENVSNQFVRPNNIELSRILEQKGLYVWSSKEDYVVIDLLKNNGVVNFNGERVTLECKEGSHLDM